MLNNRPIRLIGIIIICVTVILIVSGVIKDVNHTKRIEGALNLSDEYRRELNYKELVADIKSVENGRKPKYAKLDENKEEIQVGGIKIDTGNGEYNGDGYTIKLPPVSDVVMYEFYHNDECLYSYVTGAGGQAVDTVPRVLKTVLIIVLYGGLIVAELVLCIRYKKK